MQFPAAASGNWCQITPYIFLITHASCFHILHQKSNLKVANTSSPRTSGFRVSVWSSPHKNTARASPQLIWAQFCLVVLSRVAHTAASIHRMTNRDLTKSPFRNRNIYHAVSHPFSQFNKVHHYPSRRSLQIFVLDTFCASEMGLFTRILFPHSMYMVKFSPTDHVSNEYRRQLPWIAERTSGKNIPQNVTSKTR